MSLCEKRREKMIAELTTLKMECPDLNIFMKRDDGFEPYAVISDGKNIIYVQFGEFGVMEYAPSYEYIPDRTNGDGCGIYDQMKEVLPNHITRTFFNECVKIGSRLAAKYGAKRWGSFESYMDHQNRMDRYKEIRA